MDVEKFKSLTDLVREAKAKDQEALEKLNQATADWKNANAVLTDRLKVLDGFMLDQQNQATAI